MSSGYRVKNRFIPYYEDGEFVSPLARHPDDWGPFAWLTPFVILPPFSLIAVPAYGIWCRWMQRRAEQGK